MTTLTALTAYIRRAYLGLGQEAINSIEDLTTSGDLAQDFHVESLKRSLAAYDWDFASTYKALSLADDADVPVIKWASKYKFPGDPTLVEFRELYAGDTLLEKNKDFEVAGRFILTNGSTLTMRYTFLETNPNNWPTKFGELYEAKLMEDLAFPVTRKLSVKTAAANNFIKVLGEATGYNMASGGFDKTQFTGILSVL